MVNGRYFMKTSLLCVKMTKYYWATSSTFFIQSYIYHSSYFLVRDLYCLRPSISSPTCLKVFNYSLPYFKSWIQNRKYEIIWSIYMNSFSFIHPNLYIFCCPKPRLLPTLYWWVQPASKTWEFTSVGNNLSSLYFLYKGLLLISLSVRQIPMVWYRENFTRINMHSGLGTRTYIYISDQFVVRILWVNNSLFCQLIFRWIISHKIKYFNAYLRNVYTFYFL